MVKIVLHDVSTLKSSMDAISRIVDDIEIKIMKDGLTINCMDRDHVTMIHYRLDERFFSTYEVDVETSVYVDTGELDKVLKRCGKSDVLELSVDGGYLKVVGESLTRKIFKIKTIDMDRSTPTLHELDENTVSMPSSLLRDVLADIKPVSEQVDISILKDKVVFESPGTFLDTRIEYLHSDVVVGESSGSYNLPRIAQMLKAYRVSDDVKLTLGVDTALQVAFEIEMGLGELIFFLAPIVVED